MKRDALAVFLGSLVFAVTFVVSMILVYIEVPMDERVFFAPPFLLASVTGYFFASRRRFLSSLITAFPAAMIAPMELAVVLWLLAGSPPGKLTLHDVLSFSLSAQPWYLMYALIVCTLGGSIALLVARLDERLRPRRWA